MNTPAENFGIERSAKAFLDAIKSLPAEGHKR